MQKGKTLDLSEIMTPDAMANQIGLTYQRLDMLRGAWLNEKRELRNFVFQTDTRKTAAASLPWKNSTTVPKLCQIRDNLEANYLAALFPNGDWLDWEGDDVASINKQKATLIKSYVKNRLRASGFQPTVAKLVLDWIDAGNAFGHVAFVDETVKRPDGSTAPGYVGPKLFRVSPYDIVFDPTAASFDKSPKIVRSLKSIGTLAKEVALGDHDMKKAFERARDARQKVAAFATGDMLKSDGFMIDGFSSWTDYFLSNTVEVLTFYGDLYDIQADKLYENHVIKVMDRNIILSLKPNTNPLGKDHFFHCGWRERPDNLYAMGPLDNLVGMQYRMDHLENLSADAFDMIAFPMHKIKGDVESYSNQPGEKIYVGDEGDVTFLHPDTTALQADTKIDILERRMEDLAGAPKQAMGIRTPGEKTAYEMQSLDNAASRIFQNKTLKFEQDFLAHLLNAYLEIGLEHFADSETIKILDDETSVEMFKTVTKEDIKANGRLRPVGASHFARRAQFVQNLTQLLQSPIGQDPSIAVHLSGLRLAKAAEEILGLEKFAFVQENIRLMEQLETARMQQLATEQLQTETAVGGGFTDGQQPPEGQQPLDETPEDAGSGSPEEI